MNAVDLTKLKNALIILVPKMSKKVKTSDKLHVVICDLLKKFPSELDNMSESSTSIKNCGRAIDAAWVSKHNKRRTVFKVDGGLRKRSIRKLKSVNADCKVWIYYGNVQGVKEFLKINDSNGEVIPIIIGNLRKNIKIRKKMSM